jgi:hypothetical protein
MPWDETFDVGVDTRTPVDDDDYQMPFRFTGEIAKLPVDWSRQKWATGTSTVLAVAGILHPARSEPTAPAEAGNALASFARPPI